MSQSWRSALGEGDGRVGLGGALAPPLVAFALAPPLVGLYPDFSLKFYFYFLLISQAQAEIFRPIFLA